MRSELKNVLDLQVAACFHPLLVSPINRSAVCVCLWVCVNVNGTQCQCRYKQPLLVFSHDTTHTHTLFLV